MKVIAYSLWGSNPLYTYGMIENVILAQSFFPDYEVRIYYNSSVPKKIIDFLRSQKNTRLCFKTMNGNSFGNSTWRLQALFEDDIDILLCRDADSRLSKREKEFVDLWLNTTNKDFCIIRECGTATKYPMGGGSFSVRNGLCNKKGLKERFYATKWSHSYDNETSGLSLDVDYLKDVIYPHIKTNMIVFLNESLGNIRLKGETDDSFFIVPPLPKGTCPKETLTKGTSPQNDRSDYFGSKITDISFASTILGEGIDRHVNKNIMDKRFDNLNKKIRIPQEYC